MVILHYQLLSIPKVVSV